MITFSGTILLVVALVIIVVLVIAGAVFLARQKTPIGSIAIYINGYREFTAYRTQTGFAYVYLFDDILFVPTDELSGVIKTEDGDTYSYKWLTDPNQKPSTKPQLDEV